MKKVLLLESIHPEGRRMLDGAANVLAADDEEDALRIAAANTVHGIVTRGKGQVRVGLLDRCPGLRVIGRVGVGLDNIDVEEARSRGIKVVNVPGSTTTAVAEHTLMLILALVRGLLPLAGAVKRGEWNYRDEYRGDDVAGKTLGIIGMGAIGQRVAELAKAFGMFVVYWNRTEKDVPFARMTLSEVLERSDIVSLSVALTPDTIGLIGAEEFALMKPGAFLVNTARGAVVDQAALIGALSRGHLGGFAADVLGTQPPASDDPLLQFDNVIVTPHAAALTERTFREMTIRCVTDVLSALRDGPAVS